MSGSIKIINTNVPVREGSAIIQVDKNGTIYKINPVISPSVIANSGCWDNRFQE